VAGEGAVVHCTAVQAAVVDWLWGSQMAWTPRISSPVAGVRRGVVSETACGARSAPRHELHAPRTARKALGHLRRGRPHPARVDAAENVRMWDPAPTP